MPRDADGAELAGAGQPVLGQKDRHSGREPTTGKSSRELRAAKCAVVQEAKVLATLSDTVVIEILSVTRYTDHYKLHNEFLASQQSFNCIPISVFNSLGRHKRRLSRWPPGKTSLCAFAVRNGKAIGVTQMAMHGMPCELHMVTRGECHIEHIAVAANAQTS